MFLAGDEFGNTQFGNNNSYCQDNEISWLDWGLLDKNRELFEFFKFMIHYRQKHPVIRKKLPDAICGMEAMHSHDVRAERTNLPENAKTIEEVRIDGSFIMRPRSVAVFTGRAFLSPRQF